MKKRITNVLLILALFGYLIFVGRSDYLLQWLARNNFCYVWVLISLLWLLKLDVCAKWLTAGSILAVFPAQIMEDINGNVMEGNPAVDSAYWGVGVWIALTAIFLIIGAALQYRKWRKAHPKPVKSAPEVHSASEQTK